jgi:hypothetical protein
MKVFDASFLEYESLKSILLGVRNFKKQKELLITLLCLKNKSTKMKTIKLTLLGIMVVLTAGLRAQTTVYDNPGGTITISSDLTYQDHVIIKPLTKVVINPGVTIKLKPNKTIVIEKGGAQLVVNGTITCDGNIAQGEKWAGIQVLGDKNIIQPDINGVINGWYPGSNSNTQGILVLNNAYLTHVINAATSTDGGIIYCNNSIVDYAILAFQFGNYPNRQLCSRILNTTIYSRYSTNNVGFDLGMINCVSVYGLGINNVTFIANFSNTISRTAIRLGNASVHLSNSRIEGFSTGILQESFIGSIKYQIRITNSVFENNTIGLLASGQDYLRLNGNSFIGNSSNAFSRAVIMSGSTGYEYYGNTHSNYRPTSSNFPPSAIIINNSGFTGNRINNNAFNDNFTSISCMFNNRGLQLQCNNFNTTNPSANTRNIDVYGDNTFPISTMGIPNQGALINNDVIGYYLPGNLFSNDCGHGTPADIQANNDVQSFMYFHHIPSLESRIKPDCNSSNKVFTIQASINTATLPQVCALQYNDPGLVMDRIGIKDQLIQAQLVEMPENYLENIIYLKQSIEADIYTLMHIYAEMENDSMLVAFLTHDITPQKRMAYIQYLIEEKQFDDALIELGNLTPDSLNPDIEVFKTYFTRLTELLENNADLTQLSNEDIALFTDIAATPSPTASKAQNLLALASGNDLVNSVANTKGTQLEFNLYPNPAKDAINISGNTSFSNYVIFDITMKQVAAGKIINNAIELKNIEAGVYFVKLSDDKTSVTRKIIIND